MLLRYLIVIKKLLTYVWHFPFNLRFGLCGIMIWKLLQMSYHTNLQINSQHSLNKWFLNLLSLCLPSSKGNLITYDLQIRNDLSPGQPRPLPPIKSTASHPHWPPTEEAAARPGRSRTRRRRSAAASGAPWGRRGCRCPSRCWGRTSARNAHRYAVRVR